MMAAFRPWFQRGETLHQFCCRPAFGETVVNPATRLGLSVLGLALSAVTGASAGNVQPSQGTFRQAGILLVSADQEVQRRLAVSAEQDRNGILTTWSLAGTPPLLMLRSYDNS